MNMTNRKTALLAGLIGASLFAVSGCKVEKTQEGKMPDVEVSGGQAPKYDVETPEVKMGTETRTVEVPTATVEMPSDPDSKVTDEPDSDETPNPK